MANISYEEILSIQRKANIVDIIRDYVPLIQRGKNYFGICPFHDDHNPSMSVSPEKGVYKCFVCGNAGKPVGRNNRSQACADRTWMHGNMSSYIWQWQFYCSGYDFYHCQLYI